MTQARTKKLVDAMSSLLQEHQHGQGDDGLVLYRIPHRSSNKESPSGFSSGELVLYPNMVKFTPARLPFHAVNGGYRGEVVGFSRASRKRMIELLCSVSNLRDVFLLTLTYPGSWQPPAQPTEMATESPEHGLVVEKGHLDAFIKRLKRRWPHVAYIWRLEPQKRGAPHYHLLVWNVPVGRKKLIRWLTVAWGMIAHSEDQYRGEYATRVDKVHNWRHANYYVSKYVGKVADEPDNLRWGRRWGYGGKITVASATIEINNLSDSNIIRQLLLLVTKQDNPRWWRHLIDLPTDHSFTIFGVGLGHERLEGYLKGYPRAAREPP